MTIELEVCIDNLESLPLRLKVVRLVLNYAHRLR